MAEWVNAEVKEVKNWTDALFSLRVKAPIDPFIAGQFAKLALEIDGERVQRAYSYVNAPKDDLLEFYLVTVPEEQTESASAGTSAWRSGDGHQRSGRILCAG